MEALNDPRWAGEVRSRELLAARQEAIYRRTDRMFASLMVFQWVAGVVAALWISPQTWIGEAGRTHPHVWAAILLGGTISGLPIFLARTRPGWVGTRQVIAAGQMLTSALLIHLFGGRIETHFHIFGSLAFLAFYRDWRVLVTATVVTASDHFFRGVFWPESIFGVLLSSPWRWLEHAGWVLFEDAFLLLSLRQNLREMRGLAERQAELEGVNTRIELEVAERTGELKSEIVERKQAEAELKQAHRELLEISRQAGMAEVATAVLHNVGNVLNSVNVAAVCMAGNVRKSKAPSLTRVVTMLQEQSADLGAFFTRDPRGQQLPGYLGQLAGQLTSEQAALLHELAHLQKNIEHIKEIVTMQQTYAKVSGLTEQMQAAELVEDTLRLNAGSFAHHQVRVVRDFAEVPTVTVEKHKVLQILVNLVRNAKHACEATDRTDKQVTLRIFNGDGMVKIAVADNGIGICPENLTRIFSHGFTTKKDGHGFGLHSAALSIREMGGNLRAQSAGPGLGATFTLELPVATPALSPPVSPDAGRLTPLDP